MKLGEIGEEMVATAIKLAEEHGSEVEALHVIRVPPPCRSMLPCQRRLRAAESIESRLLGEDHGVTVVGRTVRARSIGDALVHEALRGDVDLIVLGSAPRWRRQSRFFSPTVEHVLRKAPCEVVVVAVPESALVEGDVE
jgi:nucleotide-binding universal stress UspA family protein